MAGLALIAQLCERSHRGLKRHVVIGHMELVNVDAFKTQTLQASFDSLSEMFWAGIVCPQAGAGTFPSSLGRNDQPGWIRIERFGNEFFRDARPIRIGGVDQVYA